MRLRQPILLGFERMGLTLPTGRWTPPRLNWGTYRLSSRRSGASLRHTTPTAGAPDLGSTTHAWLRAPANRSHRPAASRQWSA